MVSALGTCKAGQTDIGPLVREHSLNQGMLFFSWLHRQTLRKTTSFASTVNTPRSGPKPRIREAGCTMSDVESDKHENDQEERRPFFGSVRPKMDKNKGVRYSIVHPLTQANFVGIFTLSTIVSYTLVN